MNSPTLIIGSIHHFVNYTNVISTSDGIKIELYKIIFAQ